MANELPEDLVTLILLWLPVVSLLRFKCVCKSWYALITQQNFVRKHLLHNKNSNTHLLLNTFNKTMEDYVVYMISYEELQISLTQPLPPPFFGNGEKFCISVVGSCNGLVCLHEKRFHNTLKVVIWNPTTKETKVVPKSNLPLFAPAEYCTHIQDACMDFGSVSGAVPGSVLGLGEVFSFDLGPVSSASYSVSVLGFDPDPGSISASGHAPLPLVSLGAAGDGFGSSLVVPAASDPVLSTMLVSKPATTTVSRSATPVGSPCLFDSTHLGFGLSKLQIWLLEWIKDRLKINEEVKDKDHSAFLKGMEEDFRWINLVACEQGRLEVDKEDIRSISVVACEEGRWEVDEEEDDRKVAWLNEMKEELRLTVA
ncbi:hypothetical protein FH972_000446 [Carpinus fangiana]|uniref:F-box domain-containing protein n=1 Tax=Carpinus fangiana TaxID=176857 RepID=A0A5N6Q945_9ROSI|nr:hypothetical protein FH972_000446 [Carpinus fangiana]